MPQPASSRPNGTAADVRRWNLTRETLSDGMRGFRRYAMILTLLAFVVSVGIYFGREVIHERVRRAIETRLNEHYAPQGVRVEIASLRFVEGEGFELGGVRFLSQQSDQPDEVIIAIERVELKSTASILDVVRDEVEIDEIEIDGLRALARRDESGRWNLQDLFPPPSMGNQPAPTRLKRGHVDIEWKTESDTIRASLRNVSANTHWDVNEADPEQESGASRLFRFRTRFDSEQIESIEIAGAVDVTKEIWAIRVDGNAIDLENDWLKLLPSGLSQEFRSLNSLDGLLDVDGTVFGDFRFEGMPNLRLNGRVREGRIDDARLPYPLDGVSASFRLTNSSFSLDDLSCRFGSGRLKIDGTGSWPVDPQAPLRLTAKGERIHLNESLIATLPESMQKVWRDFQPRGLIDLEIGCTYDGARLVPYANVQLLNVSFVPRSFPYRVDNCVGQITWRDGDCEVDFQGLASGRIVSFRGNIYTDHALNSEVRIDLAKPIPLDEKMMIALGANPKLQSTIRAYHLTGMVTGTAVLRRAPTSGKLALHWLHLDLTDGSVLYHHIAYPIHGIHGTILYEDEQVKFQNLMGENDGGTIHLNGVVGKHGRLGLTFIGSTLQLEDELRDALPESLQTIWRNLRPQGTIDHVKLVVDRETSQHDFEYELVAARFRGERRVDRDLSIQPVWFPYRLRDLTGSLHYHNGEVHIREFEAFAGNALVSTEGVGRVDALGWITEFRNVSVDGLVIDESFLAAMPNRLSGTLRQMQPEGPLYLFGRIVLSAKAPTLPREAVANQDSLVVEWDINVDMDNGRLFLGRPVESVFGGVRLIGRQDATGTHQIGHVNVDSMLVGDVQFSGVHGPLRIESERVLFGRWAKVEERGFPPQTMVANVFGGQLNVDARINLNAQRTFVAQAYLEGADLRAVSRDLARSVTGVSGTAHGWLQLTGNASGSSSYEGNGFLRLRDAKIYEFPLMLSLLKVLSIKQPDSTAFTTSNIDFQIIDEHVYFDRMEFIGDAISLKGNGDMDFSGQLDLEFYSMVGRDEIYIPVITPLFGAASQNVLLIQVAGPIDDPEFTKTPFPVLNDTLEQLFPEARETAPAPVITGIPSITESLPFVGRQRNPRSRRQR